MNHAALSVPGSSSEILSIILIFLLVSGKTIARARIGYKVIKHINSIKYSSRKSDDVFFSDDIKTNNMKIYYADESSYKDKIDLIQIAFLP